MKKKIILLLPALFLALSLGACNGKKDSSKQSGDDSGQQQQPSGGGESSGGEGQGGEGQGGESGGEGQGGEGSGGEGSGGEGSGGEGSGGEQGGGEQSNRPAEVDPTAVDFAIGIGQKAYELKVNPGATLLPNETAEYYVEHLEFEAGQVVVFYEGGVAVTEQIGPNAGDANLVSGTAEAGFSTKAAATDATCYYQKWQDGGHSFWVQEMAGGGQQGGGEGQEGAITYTCTDLPDWITNDGCVIFAWVWSPSDEGSWKACQYGEPATSLTFEVSEELTGFLLARCIAGTTQPDWNIKTDEVGRVYNQTDDITCTAGTHSYACASWKAYN